MAGCVAIILSAGRGKRMGSDIPKQYLNLNGKPVLFYSIKAFEESDVDSIIIVAGASDVDFVKNEIVSKYGFAKVCSVVVGGEERYDSVYNGLKEARGVDGAEYVMIHDGARPFVSNKIITDCIKTVVDSRACIAAMPVKDTIKVVDDKCDIVDTPSRSSLWMAQTPQCFDLNLAFDSYKKMIESGKTDGVTDDAMVVETFGGVRTKVVEASYDNIKITTPSDIIIGKSLIKPSP